MDDLDRLRFYLRDTSSPPVFSDEELFQLIDETDSFDEAIGLGWLIRAANSVATIVTSGVSGQVTERTIGKISEKYATGSSASSSSPVQSALTMANYWFGRAESSVGRWWKLEPGESFIGDLNDRIKALALGSGFYDLSRLIP